MIDLNDIKVSEEVLEIADTEFSMSKAELLNVVKRSALVTHPAGNRRYGDLLFHISEGGELIGLRPLDESKPVCSICHGANLIMHDAEIDEYVPVPCACK